ncbi:hypothetical protein T265_00861 [Opisthorchis viverrini]|uniref:Uncharacterized protein n=1 Tax=Opisthorchis viverrini TaxID=6198 RepID=A0A075ABI7_OPIVI|nr:hypothetical protein T265_00861 [Opisthorchis viverrini]KER33160.1 hypothetical protein T265_00861 [Opisthorchis viverrini]
MVLTREHIPSPVNQSWPLVAVLTAMHEVTTCSSHDLTLLLIPIELAAARLRGANVYAESPYLPETVRDQHTTESLSPLSVRQASTTNRPPKCDSKELRRLT